VSQDNTAQAQVAETSTQETKTFIRQVRTRTRRKYAPEDKIRIVLEGFRREVTVSDLCRREGICWQPFPRGGRLFLFAES